MEIADGGGGGGHILQDLLWLCVLNPSPSSAVAVTWQ